MFFKEIKILINKILILFSCLLIIIYSFLIFRDSFQNCVRKYLFIRNLPDLCRYKVIRNLPDLCKYKVGKDILKQKLVISMRKIIIIIIYF
jgi:hypothetical protein